MIRVIIIIFTLSLKPLLSQEIKLNYDLDTALYKNIKEPLDHYIKFLKSKNDSIGSQYWDPTEIEILGEKDYCLIEKELDFGDQDFLKILSYASITILKANKIDHLWKITSIFEFPEYDGKKNIQYIFHVYLKKKKNNWFIKNPLFINANLDFLVKTIGKIKYHYPKDYILNDSLANEQWQIIQDLSIKFDVQLDTLHYFFTKENYQIDQLKGFDFLIGRSGENLPNGLALPSLKMAFSQGLGEYYPHELIHLILTPKYPNTHKLFSEGVATFFGQSRGKNYTWHLRNLHNHLIKNDTIKLTDIHKLRNVDNYTAYAYVIGAYFVEKAHQKRGIEGVKALLNEGKTKKDLYKVLENEFGLKQDQIDSQIRNDLSKRFDQD